ncbi:MAG: O-antigen polymerase [Ignavibacteriaceae bacterium]|jgi:oligosaccharide repeat unit polymerase
MISVSTVVLSKWIFKKWFNHLLIHTLAWTVFLVLYELKFIRYIQISNEAFLVFFVTHIGVVSGALTVYFARDIFRKNLLDIGRVRVHSVLFEDDFKVLKVIILITSIIGFYSAYQQWTFLLNKFGSFTTIIIRANLIYRMRVAGELEGGIPYLSVLPYAGIVLSGIYTAAKNKISFYTFLPLVAIIIKDAASVGRGGIFVGFAMLVTSFFLFRHTVSKHQIAKSISSTKKLVLGSILLFTIVVTSLTVVIEFRGKYENFKGKTNVFKKWEGIPLVSASTYFYFSSDVGVFSKYFEKQSENPMIGENTLLPFYNLISKLGLIEHPNFYPRGYNIPNWSNAATYLKDIHADFGNLGLFLIPYLISLISTFFWFRFFINGDLIAFTNLTYLYVINAFSVFSMITRAAFFVMSFLFLLICISFIERYWNRIKMI